MGVRQLTPLTTCEKCNAHIWADDVFKTFVVPKAPNHLALVFRCAKCNLVDRMAAQQDEWEVVKDVAIEHKLASNVLVKEMEIDMANIENVNDLVEEWASYGPARREGLAACQCDQCRKRNV